MTDTRHFRDVMGRFATGVAIITGRGPEGDPFGFTANALTSVSLRPRLVLVCVDERSTSLPSLLAAGRFAISLLGRDGAPLARRFALPERDERFRGIPPDDSPDAAPDAPPDAPPVLPEAIAWLDCRLWREVEAGDHIVIFGEVLDCGLMANREPLVFFEGRYRTLCP